MKAHAWDWLPVLFVLVAACLALRGEPRHETCNNEKRYENQVMCAGVQFGYRAPYPDNCSLYLVCDCEYPTVLPCPGQLWWNNDTQNCDWPQNTKCIYYNIDTTPKTTKATTAATPPSTTPMTSTTDQNWPTSSYDPPPPPPGIPFTFCRNLPDGSVHRYPYDCNAYINCTHGYPVLNYCEPDKVFNQVLLICDTPETADCEPLPLPPITTEHPTETTTAEPTTATEDVECGAPPFGIEEDYCVPLGNGFYEYPYDCSAYISCRQGCTYKDFCIPDKLFNPILHICDTPNSVHCNPKPYPTTTIATTPGSTEDPSTSTNGGESVTPDSSTTTTTVATTTTPALPADVDPDLCVGLPDYTRFPYAADCSQFLQCSNNQVIVGQCAEPLLFNPDFLICDSADDVICYGDRTTTTSTTSTTEAPTTTTSSTTVTTTPTTTPGPDKLCANEPFYTTFPYVQDCTSYILCLGDGEYYIAKCISNTYYDPKTGDCGANVLPTACREQDTTTTRTTEATTEKTTTEVVTSISTPTTSVATTTSPTPGQPGGICGSRDEGELIAYPNDCSKYIVCVTPIPVAFYCRPGSYFSAKQQQCVSWEDSDCDKDTATTPGYTGPPLEPTMCTNSSRDTFPYPENCQWFIRCVNDYIYMMDVCNCGEYYDPINGKCGADVPSDACRWDYTSTTTEATPTPTTTEPTPVTRPPPQEGPCDDAADGELVPYPDDCSKYIKCDRPIAAAYDCADGDEFSPVLRECMEASLANCTVGTTPGHTESTTGPTTPSWPGSTTGSDTTTDSTSNPASTTTPEISTTSETSTTPETSEPSSSTTPETTTTQRTTTPAPSGGICSGKPNGTLVPYPNNCGKYIVCQEPIPIGYDCPENLEFSPTELECMDPELANCEPRPTTATTTAPTTTEWTTTPSCDTSPNTTPTTPTTTTTPDTTGSTTPETSETDSTSTTPEASTITTFTTEWTTTPPCDTSPNTTPTTPTTTTTPDTTASTTPETSETDSTSTTPATTTIHPDTPNICCGHPLGTILPYPNDCNRYVVCDYPIPYAVVCEEGTVFDVEYLQCTTNGKGSCI
ncbi:uncharacterized protein Dvir_GJ13404, isoform A [Drosophila virilis]|uniref:Uncharacterized protein, isoform A n=1 Tax=Drosophila virilis TaxID=7244 RepID=B4LBD1_DROVI|nr:uncharacterized protein Dvir_GJ13404, isoform A [Drosophila virilis]